LIFPNQKNDGKEIYKEVLSVSTTYKGLRFNVCCRRYPRLSTLRKYVKICTNSFFNLYRCRAQGGSLEDVGAYGRPRDIGPIHQFFSVGISYASNPAMIMTEALT